MGEKAALAICCLRAEVWTKIQSPQAEEAVRGRSCRSVSLTEILSPLGTKGQKQDSDFREYWAIMGPTCAWGCSFLLVLSWCEEV